MYACSTSIGVRVSSSGRLAETAAGLGPSVEVYPPVHVETVPPDLFGASLRHAERKLDLLAELGARVLVCCSSRTTRGLDDDDLTAEQLHTMAGRAEQRGELPARVRSRALGTYSYAQRNYWHIVRDVDHPALGMCLDSFHVLTLDNDPAVIAEVAGKRVFHVQLAHAPRLNGMSASGAATTGCSPDRVRST